MGGATYAVVHSLIARPLVMLGMIAIVLTCHYLSRWIRGKEPQGPALNQIAEAYLRKKEDLDSAKFYAVVVDADMGNLIAHCEGTRPCLIREFIALEEAHAFARDSAKEDE